MESETISGYRMSPQQDSLWPLCHSRSAAFQVTCEAILEGSLDTEKLGRAIERVIARHEILRTTFHRLTGMSIPVQIPGNRRAQAMTQHDLRNISPQEQTARIAALYEEISQTPFDFERGPLVRFSLVTLSDVKRALFVSLPSLCSDRTACKNLLAEIAHSYEAPAQAETLNDEVIQYAELSEWQNDLLESNETQAGREYWKEQDTVDFFSLKLPSENSSGDEAFKTAYSIVALTADLTARIEERAGGHNASIGVFLLACWQTLLWRLTGQSPIVVGCCYDGRKYQELEQSQGLFARYLPVRCVAGENSRFSDMVRQADESTSEIHKWQEYFSWDIFALAQSGESARPFFPISFEFDEQPQKLSVAGISFSMLRQQAHIDRFKIKLSCIRTSDDLIAEFHYDSSLFQAEDIGRLAMQFRKVVECAADDPSSLIAEMGILGDAEKHTLLVEFNDTRVDYVERRLQDLFEEQALSTPDNLAVSFEDCHLTYSELNEKANQLANHIRGLGVRAETRVGIFTERSNEMIECMLATLKAGGAYVPMELSYPKERLAYMIEDAGVEVVLSQEWLLERLPPTQAKVVCLSRDRARVEQCSSENLKVDTAAENLAYVIYTSGSTGKPKGVAVEHRQLVNYLNAIKERLDLPSEAGFATVSTLAADLGYTVVFPSLCTGGRLHVLSIERISDADSLADYFSRHQIDCLKIVPSHLEALLASRRAAQIVPLQRLIMGGEASSWDTTERLKAMAPRCEIYNHYGPTESTVGVLTYRFNPELSEKGSLARQSLTLPLGRPLSNTQVYLLDSNMQPVPTGVPGELFIAGAGLARGYLNKAEMTAEKFLPNPFAQAAGDRMYRTGDLARFLGDGNVEFLGRVDDQVKVRGYRIELGEIETVLGKHPGVQNVVVLPKEDESGNKKLVAYVVPEREYSPIINGQPRYRLPNGLSIVHQNKNETDYTYHEIFDEQSYFRHGIAIADGECVFDVGANIGLFTLFVSRHYPAARIYSLEPIASIFNLLEINADLYCRRAKAMQIGLSDRERIEEFTYYPGYSVMSGLSAYTDAKQEMATVKTILHNRQDGGIAGASALIDHADELLADHFEGEELQCRLRTISNVIKDEGIEQIGLLKIDVQRAELDVLKGIRDEDWVKIRQIVMEVHDRQGEKTEGRLHQIAAILEDRGYKVVTEQDALFKNTDRHTLYAIRESADISLLPGRGESVLTDAAAPLAASELADYLRDRLPEYMIPSGFMMLEALPLNSNGKIDRAALSAEEFTSSDGGGYAAPGTPVEKTLAEIWAKVLGVERVGINDNFFKLGGDSIMSIQVIVRAGQAGIKLTPRQLFQHPTIAQQAAVANTTAAVRAEQGLVTGPFPLTPIQRWFFDENPIDHHHWNMAVMLEAREKIEPVALTRALESLIAHHDALRLKVERTGSSWEQSIAGIPDASALLVIDLTGVPEADRIPELEIAAAQVQSGIGLLDGRIMQVALFDLGEGAFDRLLIAIHHLGVDGVSWRILLEDLQAAYDRFRAGERVQLPPKTTSYMEWAKRLSDYAQSPELRREAAYWIEQGRDRAASVPVDFEGERNTVDSTSTVSVSLTPDETRSLIQEVPNAYNTQINDVLLTALAQAFREWAGTPTLLVDLEGHGREEIPGEVDISRTVGCFTTRFPVAINLGEFASLGEELKCVKELLRSVPNRGIGYGLLRYSSEDAIITDALRRLPRPEISFNYLGQLDQALDGFNSFAPARESSGPPRSPRALRRHLLEINGQVAGGRLEMTWRYSEGVHHRAGIAKLAQLFIEALQALINHCMSPEAGGYSPSDFADFGWSQEDLDDIVSKIIG